MGLVNNFVETFRDDYQPGTASGKIESKHLPSFGFKMHSKAMKRSKNFRALENINTYYCNIFHHKTSF